jgi:hypothetical protein
MVHGQPLWAQLLKSELVGQSDTDANDNDHDISNVCPKSANPLAQTLYSGVPILASCSVPILFHV